MSADLYRPLGLHLGDDRDRAARLKPGVLLGAAFALAAITGSVATALLAAPGLRNTDAIVTGTVVAGASPASAKGVSVVSPPVRVDATPMPTIISGSKGTKQFAGVETTTPATNVTFHVENPGSLRQNPNEAAFPDRDLLEQSAYGDLPKRDPGGRRPFDVYAGASSGQGGTRIAIVVGGLGISQTGTQAAIRKLPAGVTLGFAPSGNSLKRWMQAARQGGHELLLQVPMEPVGYPTIDPGPETVTVDETKAGRFDTLYASLGRLTNYVGVMNYMGGRFAGDPAAMRGFLGELGRRGLMYLDDQSSGHSSAGPTAHDLGVPEASSTLTIDRSQDPAAIAGELDRLETIARVEGSAIGVASAFDTSVDTVADWIAKAEKRGVTIVPVSALADDPERR